MDPALKASDEHHAFLKELPTPKQEFTFNYSREALVDMITQQLAYREPLDIASKKTNAISEQAPSANCALHDQLIKAFLVKLGPVWHKFYAFNLKDFCHLAMLKILLTSLDCAKGSKNIIKCLQLYAELVEALQSNPKEANLLIQTFFKERLPGLLQLPLEVFQEMMKDVASIAGLIKCHQGSYQEIFRYHPSHLENIYGQGASALFALQEQFLKLAIEHCTIQKRQLHDLRAKHVLGQRSTVKRNYFEGVSKIFGLLNRLLVAVERQESLFIADLRALQALAETTPSQESLCFLISTSSREMQRVWQQLGAFEAEIESYQTSLCYLTELETTPASEALNSQLENLGIQAITSLWMSIGRAIDQHKLKLDPKEEQKGHFPDFFLFLAKLFSIFLTHPREKKARNQIDSLQQQWHQKELPWFNMLIEELATGLPRLLSENLNMIVQHEKTLLAPVEDFWQQSLTSLFGITKQSFQQKILKLAPGTFSVIAQTLKDYREKEFNAYHYLDELSCTLKSTSALLLKFPQLLNSATEKAKLAFLPKQKKTPNAEEAATIKFCLSLLKSETDVLATLKQAFCPAWQKLLDVSKSLLPHLPQKEDVDLEALWLQRVERSHGEEKPAIVFENYDSASSEEEDALTSQSEMLCNLLPNTPHTISLASESALGILSRSMLPPTLPTISSVSKLPQSAAQKMFTYDMAFHLKLMDSALAMLQQLLQRNSSEAAVQTVIATLLNSTYYALEQARTPYVASDRSTPLKHGLKHLYGNEPAIIPLDLQTVWYRYPFFSLALRSQASKIMPQGLKLLLAPLPLTEQLAHLQKMLSPLSELLLNAANRHTDLLLESLNASNIWQEWSSGLKQTSEVNASLPGYEATDTLSEPFRRLEKLLPSLHAHYACYFSSTEENLLELATYQDLITHLERLRCVLLHASAFRTQSFICLHASQMLMCGQYLTELSFVLQSIKEKNELRTHALWAYRNVLQKQYPQKMWEFIENYLDMGKGLDYPFWTFYKSRGKLKPGMTVLSQAFSIAKHPEGFMEAHTKTSGEILRQRLCDIAAGIIDILESSISN